MNCEEFIEQLSVRCDVAPSDAEQWESHRKQCASCNQLFRIAQRLEQEANAHQSQEEVASGGPTYADARQLTRSIQQAARGRRRRQASLLVAAACIAAVSVFGLVNQIVNRADILPEQADVADIDAPSMNKDAIAATDSSSRELSNTALRTRKAIMRVVDKSGQVHELPVLVVSNPQRRIKFDELSPLERQIVRRYLELRGIEGAVCSL